MKQWVVYIIQTQSGALYTGITNDLEKRLAAHAGKRTGARFFRFSGPAKVVYQEKAANRSTSSQRERAIKKMTRSEKLQLISKNW
jgi:putative endonuclease